MRADGPSRHAFGVAFSGDLDLPGLPSDTTAAPVRRATVRRADQRALEASWPRATARRLSEEAGPDGTLRTIESAGDAGYLLDAPGFGLARVSADGTSVECTAPADGSESWRWQRFLVGRVLPFAAALAGLEPLHAGAVVLGGRAIAVLGCSGAGKSSITARLMLRGAPFLTDDVLSLELVGGDGVLAYPGAAVLSLRDADSAELGALADRLGKTMGTGGGKRYIAPIRATGPVPLGALVAIERGAPKLALRRCEHPDARLLLGAAFVPEVATPSRLLGQLELLARVAHAVPVFTLEVPAAAGADDVAATVLDAFAPSALGR